MNWSWGRCKSKHDYSRQSTTADQPEILGLYHEKFNWRQIYITCETEKVWGKELIYDLKTAEIKVIRESICQKIGLSALRMGQKWTERSRLSENLSAKSDRWKGKQWRNELLHSSGKPRSIGHIILPVLLLGLESTIFLLLPDSPATVSNMHTLIFCYIRSSDKLLHLYKSFIHSIPPAKVTGSTY